ncbi:MAG: hypothetical protein [Macrobrachium rosenbergii virus 2]|nr:MAG: hypothetical protein [Macrobrachium rosenbergii virus 2]
MNGGNVQFSTFELGASSSRSNTQDVFSAIPNLSNPLNLSFFGVSNYYSSLTRDWDDVEKRVAENAAAQKGEELTTLDNSRASELSIAGLTSGLEDGEEATEELTSGLLEGEEVAESSAGPLGIALMANQQVGNAVALGLEGSQNQIMNQNYVANSSQHGLNVGLNSSLIRASQDAQIRSQTNGAMAGSMFGPLGALIGHAIGGVIASNPTYLNTAASFQGAVNPTDTGIVASESTSAMTGESTMQDDITGTASS